MNLPNKLTLARFIITPFFLASMLIQFPHHYLVALVIFIAASLTDLFDGKIARARGLVTNFGKFLDPIADKLLTSSAYIAFLALGVGYGMAWILFIVLAREFIVTSVRLIAADNGKVIAANMWGKAKTVMQMVAIIFTIAALYFEELFVNMLQMLPVSVISPINIVCSVLLWISGILTLVAGVTYIVDNREFLRADK